MIGPEPLPADPQKKVGMVEEKKITHTGEGIPVGSSPEEEKLRELNREGKLPEGAKLRGIPADDEDALPKE
jgi:hypothetical protein